MNKVLYIILIFLFTLTILSCDKDEPFYSDPFTDTTAPVIEEVTFVTTPTNDSTPDYTFSSDEAGTITYGGSCSSSTTSAIDGNNTITLVSLSEGTYSDCTITVTDEAGNISITLTITSFFVDTTVPVISGSTITTPTNDSTPNYTFSSDEAGTITYGGSCSSGTTSAISGNNIITLDSLSDGTYSNCTITVTDSGGNSVTLNITSFTVAIPPTIEEVTFVTTPTNDSTPDYTFSSDEAGTITYGGSCSSSTTSAIDGNITITLVSLSEGTYSNCTITVTDSAGNASSALSVSTFVVDTTAPSVSSFTLSDTALITGDNATVTLVFSEAVASFSSSADITVANGTLAVMTSTDNITWAGTFTPTANTEDDNNTLSLATSYTDTAGNTGPAATTLNYVVDTTAPSVSSFTLSDTALITGDNATVTLVFSEAVASFSSSADITVANGTLAVMTSTDNITWAGTFTPTANTEDDNNTLSLATSYTDTAGNTGPAATTLNYVVDTTAPTVSSISPTDNQSSVSITDNITVTFSEAMHTSYITADESTGCGASIQVSSDNFNTCVRMSDDPEPSNSNMTFTLDPVDNLTVGTTYKIRVTTGVRDTAGNAMSSQYETSSGFTPADLTAPTVSSVSTTADNQSSVAITDNITVTFSEAMDTTYVTTNTDNTSCYGTLGVSSDNFSSCVQMSSAPASSSDNMTFTLNPSDNLTGSTTYLTRVTTGVKDSAGNTLSSQYETSSVFTTEFTTYWQLIARQVDSDNFTDGTNELFSSNARSTFLENDNDSSSSTFMSIGNLNKSHYADNGTYKFKLVWDGMQVDSLDNKSVTWTQTSWLDNTTTQGFQEIGDSGLNTGADPNTDFVGLALSTDSTCVFDGDGGTKSNRWWNCVGVVSLHTYNGSTGMPGPLQKIASSMHLYIWAPRDYSQLGGSIQGTELSLSTAVTTLAGSSQGSTNATGTSAQFNKPRGITTDGTNLYVADSSNHRIRKIVISTGVVTTLAGSSQGALDATGTSARFNSPRGITTDGTNLYVSDWGNHRIRKIE